MLREADSVEPTSSASCAISTTSSIICCQRSGCIAIGRSLRRSSSVAGNVGRKKYMNFIVVYLLSPRAKLGHRPGSADPALAGKAAGADSGCRLMIISGNFSP